MVELMVTLSVAAVLMAVAAPAFKQFLASSVAEAVSKEMASALRMARSEALKRSLPVTICPTADPTAAMLACGVEADWKTGWVMFSDANADGARNGSDTILSIYSASNGAGDVTGGNTLTFLPNGVLLSAAATIVIKTADNNSGSARTVCVGKTGRVLVKKGEQTC